MVLTETRDAGTDALAFLAGGEEMGERIRAFDWSKTPLGPAESWSPSLRTVVRLMLANRLPMVAVHSRLLRARTMLAKRLAEHGLAVAGGSVAALLCQHSLCVGAGLGGGFYDQGRDLGCGGEKSGKVSVCRELSRAN